MLVLFKWTVPSVFEEIERLKEKNEKCAMLLADIRKENLNTIQLLTKIERKLMESGLLNH